MNETRLLEVNKRAYNDLAVIALGAIIVFLLSAYYDFLERGLNFAQRYHDSWHVDDIIAVLVFLAFAFGAFSWRRWWELANVIKEERQAAAALQTSVLMFSHAIEQSGDGIMSTDKNGVIEYVNAAFEETTGYTKLEVIGKTPGVLRSDVHNGAFYKAMWREILSGRSFRYAFTNRKKNGEYYIDDRTITPVKDAKGYITHFVSTGRDITERKQIEKRLRDSHKQLRALNAHLQNIREEERSRIARSIHDDLGQALTALKMDLSFIQKTLWETNLFDPRHTVFESLNAMGAMADTMIQSVRDITTELRPALLDSLGLMPAIEWQAAEFKKKTGVLCECSSPETIPPLDHMTSTALFRIFQESLTNVARHAKASRVDVALKKDVDSIVLGINDDGVGIAEDQVNRPTSFGLLGIRERAFAVGGSVDIKGRAGNGTNVTVRIPLKPQVE